MLDRLVANAGQYIHTNPWLALVAVFLGGIITASNPCVLAMIPLMMSFVAGRKNEKASIGRASLYSLVFILGLAVTFTALGMAAALAGKDVRRHFWNMELGRGDRMRADGPASCGCHDGAHSFARR